MLWITLVLVIVSEAVAQVTVAGNCPDLEPFSDFVLDWAMGKWYEIERSDDSSRPGDKCVTANYTLAKNGAFLIEISLISSITGEPSSFDGIASPIGNPDDVKFRVTFPSLKSVETFWILDTDYDNWLIIYSCENAGESSVQHVRILTREQNPAASVIAQAYEGLDRSKISKNYLVKTDQKNCPASN